MRGQGEPKLEAGEGDVRVAVQDQDFAGGEGWQCVRSGVRRIWIPLVRLSSISISS